MKSILSSVIDTRVRQAEKTLEGRTSSRPRLKVGDEFGSETWVVNVDVGEDNEMLDVAIATGNNELRYASAGSPVTMKKVAAHWTITGFSKTMPGTCTRIAVTIPDFDFGVPTYTTGNAEDLSYIIRALSYAELAELGTYGPSMPYGAIGKFRGSELLEVYT